MQRLYAARVDRPDRPLAPGALGPPSDPIPDLRGSARRRDLPDRQRAGMLPPQARRVAAAQKVCAFKGRKRA